MYITHDKTLHFVGITKPKLAQLQSLAEPAKPTHKSRNWRSCELTNQISAQLNN